jgi:hypothetical protein
MTNDCGWWLPAGLKTSEWSQGDQKWPWKRGYLLSLSWDWDSLIHWELASSRDHSGGGKQFMGKGIWAVPPLWVVLLRVRVCHLVPGPQQRVHHPASKRDCAWHPSLDEPHKSGGEWPAPSISKLRGREMPFLSAYSVQTPTFIPLHVLSHLIIVLAL